MRCYRRGGGGRGVVGLIKFSENWVMRRRVFIPAALALAAAAALLAGLLAVREG